MTDEAPKVTRLNVPAPKKRGRPRIPDHMKKAQVDLNMKVEADFRRKVKGVANAWDMKTKDLIQQAVLEWIERHGEAPCSDE